MLRVTNAITGCLKGDHEQYQATYRIKQDEGWRWILDRGAVLERDGLGQPLRMAGTLTDVSHLMQSSEQHRLFARTLEHISDGVVILDRHFQIVDINRAFGRITGFERDQILGSSLLFSRYPQQFTDQVKKTLTKTGRWVGELEENRADGSAFLMEMTIDAIADEHGEASHFVGVFSDITERKRTEQELLKLANSDTLTELPNRSLFYANHQHLTRRRQPHALMVFDLDNFKKINDSLGHMAGDKLLCAVAERLKRCCRSNDTLYRLGGDEFAIVIEGNNSIANLTEVAKRALTSLKEPFHVEQTDIFVTSSVGIALYPLDGQTTEDLLKKADTAMYHAKSSGANRSQFFSESMNEQAIRRIQLEALLRNSMQANTFELHYQPQYAIERAQMIGMEVLIRLRHPERGLIYPGEFIALAEESGLIVDIGEWVLRQACRTAQRWREAGLFTGRIAVNLSARQLELEDFGDRVSQILEETGLPPRALELEITEGSVMQSPGLAIATMQAIRQLGVQLALDDFGTGYSSLAYLKQFPLTSLKIDRTFVKDLESSLEDRQMASAIITIAHNLGLEVIAEGVESESQLRILSAMQCEVCQGYLLGKPMDEASMVALLRKSGGRMELPDANSASA
ncbi:MAG: EAL domain-containing protein [Gammaproteobacteria bacterium]|nr:EAL domain-containing protein [Gammaproteobacteria bacterium]